jgi:hypothetical protein
VDAHVVIAAILLLPLSAALHRPVVSQLSTSRRRLVIHSRTYAEQFSSVMLSTSQRSRKLTASWSTKVTSFKSSTLRRPSVSDLTNVSSSAMLSTSIWPLNVKTTCPLADLRIISIPPPRETKILTIGNLKASGSNAAKSSSGFLSW